MAYSTRTDGAAVGFREWHLAVVSLLTPMAVRIVSNSFNY